jgi:hypothetical protein
MSIQFEYEMCNVAISDRAQGLCLIIITQRSASRDIQIYKKEHPQLPQHSPAVYFSHNLKYRISRAGSVCIIPAVSISEYRIMPSGIAASHFISALAPR